MDLPVSKPRSPEMQRLWNKLRQLVAYDPNQTVLGSKTHKYRVYPCLSETEVAEFEQQYQVTLPRDYRRFLLEVANGGAGPDYGLHKLQDSVRERDHILLSRFWPHHTEWNLEYNDFAKSEDYDHMYFSDEQAQGALHISDIGCGHETLLVVTGEERGSIWQDFRGSDGGIVPVKYATNSADRISFSGWYEAWLDRSLAS